ncbi:MAG: L-aspartate oxidase [Spirochaetia bacterium]|nr:L-aspartate oxidase [Spirochaetia bacterium]MCF7940425.1 L-aspartate oxidase [Spirochaetia bacterium]
MQEIYDVLIIGTGIAGLTTAIRLHEAGIRLLIVSKESDPIETNTRYAQGGIIAWKQGDPPASLAADIYEAGQHYNSTDAVQTLSQDGPGLVFDFLIEHIGTQFSTDEQGHIDYTEEAAHSDRRIIHFEDHTGEQIEQALYAYAQKIGVPILADHTAIDLITNNHHSNDTQELYRQREVFGAYILENTTGEVKRCCAHHVVLATGGVGNLYQHTTNPTGATGDGISMAYHAGADIINTEFVQFHPTSLFHKDIKRFLISESLRGEGARLTDLQGNEFMSRYSPLGDLAPRDVVARSIYDQMSRDGTEYVLLNLADHYQGSQPITTRFSQISGVCKRGGIDITREPIPVVPAAHYFCGGIKVDTCARTSLKNLYAVGEVSCTGLHGANRLASTSLLEGLLWGWNAAGNIMGAMCEQPLTETSAAELKRVKLERFAHIPEWDTPKDQETFDPLLLKQDWKAIQLTMWNYAGIIRTKKGLDRAQADLGYYAHRILKFYREAQLTRDIIELRNGITTARIIVGAALHNTVSTGCHYRI